MPNIQVAEFAASHSEQIAQITAAAYANIPESQRPVAADVVAIAKLLGDENPAGRSIVAIAFIDNEPVGCCVGIANRYRTVMGTVLTAYHIGFFFVSAKSQGKGVGRLLLDALTRYLIPIPNSFIYSFPNARSIPVFRKLGYSSVSRLPTWIFLKPFINISKHNATYEACSLAEIAASCASIIIPFLRCLKFSRRKQKKNHEKKTS